MLLIPGSGGLRAMDAGNGLMGGGGGKVMKKFGLCLTPVRTVKLSNSITSFWTLIRQHALSLVCADHN